MRVPGPAGGASALAFGRRRYRTGFVVRRAAEDLALFRMLEAAVRRRGQPHERSGPGRRVPAALPPADVRKPDHPLSSRSLSSGMRPQGSGVVRPRSGTRRKQRMLQRPM